MAHSLLLLCLALTTPAVARAQVVGLGIKAGGSVTTIVGPGIPSQPEVLPLAGFVAGLYRTLPFTVSGKFSLQPELLYSQQGYRLSHPSTDYRATLRSSYICLPLLLQFTSYGFFALAGPQVGYLAGVREEYHFRSPTGPGMGVSVNTDPGDLVRWELAGVVGAGYRWHDGFGVELRYAHGINSILNTTSASYKPRNTGVQFQVSYPLVRR